MSARTPMTRLANVDTSVAVSLFGALKILAALSARVAKSVRHSICGNARSASALNSRIDL